MGYVSGPFRTEEQNPDPEGSVIYFAITAVGLADFGA